MLGVAIGGTGDEDDDWFFTFFQPYRYVINRIPVYPSIGNHDADETEQHDDRAQVEDNFYLRERIGAARIAPAGHRSSDNNCAIATEGSTPLAIRSSPRGPYSIDGAQRECRILGIAFVVNRHTVRGALLMRERRAGERRHQHQRIWLVIVSLYRTQSSRVIVGEPHDSNQSTPSATRSNFSA